MKKNMGNNDRTIRLVVALVLVLIYFFALPNIWLLVVAAVMGTTAALNFCPLYVPFKLKTK